MNQTNNSPANNLWGGRFTGKADNKFVEFNRSFGFDYRLLAADIHGCAAHCEGLRRAGVLTDEEADKIQSGLQTVLEQSAQSNEIFTDSQAEDVHSFIESRLVEIIGDAGRKLHTGRSRNDQVATALRIWLREEIDEMASDLQNTQKALLDLAEKHQTAILPGYTHLQRAQPILFAHWCLAYFEMLKRDAARLSEVRERVNVLPLGAAALAGTSFPIDRERVASDLGFATVAENSLDAVSDRDFAVEFIHAASLIMMHLSRLAEDIILYATVEFGFFELSDAVSTGSSLMPQKKNPDSMELVRGKSARVFGHLTTLLTLLKGLPMAYNKDLQEDKEAVFDTSDTTRDCLKITATVLLNLRVREDKTQAAAAKGYLNATELADYLSKKDIPFRNAHELAGKIVLRAIELEIELDDLELSEMQKYCPKIQVDIFDVLSLQQTLKTKNVIGGTAPERVEEAMQKARFYLKN
ncbi:MAG: argininosuccinate lyase [Acidobacteriota bacterium]|jgi:argininosuccinate lyase|nr:argininosuccinate lyase [Acidobacteriota bacterium]MDQ3372866.1 argininosuccinate lyase [Acidobacteriota bacterium]